MHLSALISALSFVVCLPPALAKSEDPTVQNANHIFNAIHSSMRQWGSSLNHNGMSFFLATVPAGTQLYHGTSQKESIKGMEWLAFEPEHALIFARPRGRGPPGRGPPPGEGDGDSDGERKMGSGLLADGQEWEWEHYPPPPPGPHHPHEPPEHHGQPLPTRHDCPPPPPGPSHGPPPEHYLPPPPRPPPTHNRGPPPPALHRKRDRQQPLFIPNSEEPSEEPTQPGYLHTYTPLHPLTLLYIDGMSAGKTSNGTLDTQDMLLLNLSLPSHSPMGGEFERARRLCNLSSTLWQRKIDGVLRMEGGFEIILCDFERDLEVKDVMPVVNSGRGGGGGMGRGMGGMKYLKAITDRYHGIGGGRVVLNYEKFVSVFGYTGLELWKNDVVSDTPQPRLQHVSPTQLQEIKSAVTEMILTREENDKDGRNWQQVADMAVKRYSAPLHYLNTDEAVRSSKEDFGDYLFMLLRPFIDYTSRNTTLETARCVSQIVPPLPLPPSSAPSLAHTALHTVTREVCSALLSALDITTLSLSRSLAATSPPPSHALDLIDTLVSYLQWTSWKDCGPCADDEVCLVPIWPMGTLEDHRSPRCTREGEVGSGYWGRFGRRPGGGGPSGGEDPPQRKEGLGQEEQGWGHGGHRSQKGGRRVGKKHCGARGHGRGRGRGIWGHVERAARWIGSWLRPKHGPRDAGWRC